MSSRDKVRLVVAFWAVALCPTWWAIAFVGPSTFWQTVVAGCIQLPLAAGALAGSLIVWVEG